MDDFDYGAFSQDRYAFKKWRQEQMNNFDDGFDEDEFEDNYLYNQFYNEDDWNDDDEEDYGYDEYDEYGRFEQELDEPYPNLDDAYDNPF